MCIFTAAKLVVAKSGKEPLMEGSTSSIYLDRSGSDLGSCSEEELSPPKSKHMKKLKGAATYRTKFNPDWKREFTFVSNVHGDPYRFVDCSSSS